jgi:hypothetical protein
MGQNTTKADDIGATLRDVDDERASSKAAELKPTCVSRLLVIHIPQVASSTNGFKSEAGR